MKPKTPQTSTQPQPEKNSWADLWQGLDETLAQIQSKTHANKRVLASGPKSVLKLSKKCVESVTP